MNSVIKGASYVLAHTPDMVLYNGTTQTTERIVNPDSEYLKEVPEHLRSYEDCVAYWQHIAVLLTLLPLQSLWSLCRFLLPVRLHSCPASYWQRRRIH